MIRNHMPAAVAAADNARFDLAIQDILRKWHRQYAEENLLRFDQPLNDYLAGDALRDLFLNRPDALQELLKSKAVFEHLSRSVDRVYFDPVSGDPLLAVNEQRIYNLTRRLAPEALHVPFRAVHPIKQTEAGDTAGIDSYPVGSEKIRYNSGNHFVSRPANNNVIEQVSRSAIAGAVKYLQVYFQNGYLADRLNDLIVLTRNEQLSGSTDPLICVICSRHSQKEGHFGVALVVMNPANPLFPSRVMICDTLLKELPQHPRWCPHFIETFSNVFGHAVTELIEDISHPLQKVNITGDAPYNHDWDCPYYAAAMAKALIGLALDERPLLMSGSPMDVHLAMTKLMPEYYHPGGFIKDRQDIRHANRLNRWKSGSDFIMRLVVQQAQQHHEA